MKGWECPKCGRVYAPHVSKCEGCNAIANISPMAQPWPIVPVWPYTGDSWPYPWPKVVCDATFGQLISTALETREKRLGMPDEIIADRLASLTCGCVD